MRLLVNPMDGNPTVPVRWCITKEDVDQMKTMGAVNPHVILITKYSNGQEDRQLLPLEATMTYVGFRYPGNHKLYAKVVWPHSCDDSPKHMRIHYLERKNSHRYEHEAMDLDDTYIRETYGSDSSVPSPNTNIDFHVDDGHFAKQPSERMMAWYNFLFESQPIDECSLRRRKLLSYTVQLPFVAVKAIVYLIAYLGCKYIGMRGVSIKGILDIIAQEGFNMVEPKADPIGYGTHLCNWYLHDSKCKYRGFGWMFFNPITLGIAAILTVIASKVLGIGILTILSILLPTTGVIVVGMVLINLATKIPNVGKKMESLSERIKMWIESRELESYRLKCEASKRQTEELYEEMQCASPIPWSPSIKALAPKRRTVRLYYLDLKAKVCKPFAG